MARLTVVKRYGATIAAAAAAIREGRGPELPADPANTQVLCARRKSPDGPKELNALFQAALTAETKDLSVNCCIVQP